MMRVDILEIQGLMSSKEVVARRASVLRSQKPMSQLALCTLSAVTGTITVTVPQRPQQRTRPRLKPTKGLSSQKGYVSIPLPDNNHSVRYHLIVVSITIYEEIGRMYTVGDLPKLS